MVVRSLTVSKRVSVVGLVGSGVQVNTFRSLNSYHSCVVILHLGCPLDVRRWASLPDEGLAVMRWAEPGSDPQAAAEVGERRGSGPPRPDSGPTSLSRRC